MTWGEGNKMEKTIRLGKRLKIHKRRDRHARDEVLRSRRRALNSRLPPNPGRSKARVPGGHWLSGRNTRFRGSELTCDS